MYHLDVSAVDRSWLRAGDDIVRQHLTSEMERVDGADPFSVLGVARTAKDGDIRAAFLAATKTFHPNRFARRDEAIRRLANEVFLTINKAYSRLSSAEERRRIHAKTRKGGQADTTQSPIPVSSAGEVLKPPTHPSRKAQSPARSRRPTDRATVSTTVAFKKRSGAASGPAPKVPLSVDELRRQRRRARTAGRAPTPDPAHKGSRDAEQLTREAIEREEKRKEGFRAAAALLQQGQLSSAKEMFRQLAIENPTMTKYRVHMHYTWGRELHAAGRDDEAIVEYNRSLKLDPNFEPALKSVAALRLDAGKKSPGLFSRLFGKD